MKLTVIVLVTFMVFLFHWNVFAETVMLQDDTEVRGNIISKTAQTLQIKTTSGLQTYPMDTVRYIIGENGKEINNKSSLEKERKLADNAIKGNDFSAAVRHLKTRIEALPNSTEDQYKLGLCYVELREFNAAIKAFNKAVEMDPDKEDGYLCLGIAYKMSGNLEKARENFSKSIKWLEKVENAKGENMGFQIWMIKKLAY